MAELKSIKELLKNSNVTSIDNKDPLTVYKEFENTLPFKVVQFANRFGVRVFSSNLEPNISGMIKGKEIFINKNDSLRRQLFTATHELSHFLLGHGDKQDYVFRKKSYDTQLERDNERDANELAAEFLMPKDKFEKSLNALEKSNPNDNVSDRITRLALEFGVSEIAISVRLDKIGYYNGGYYC